MTTCTVTCLVHVDSLLSSLLCKFNITDLELFSPNAVVDISCFIGFSKIFTVLLLLCVTSYSEAISAFSGAHMCKSLILIVSLFDLKVFFSIWISCDCDPRNVKQFRTIQSDLYLQHQYIIFGNVVRNHHCTAELRLLPPSAKTQRNLKIKSVWSEAVSTSCSVFLSPRDCHFVMLYVLKVTICVNKFKRSTLCLCVFAFYLGLV